MLARHFVKVSAMFLTSRKSHESLTTSGRKRKYVDIQLGSSCRDRFSGRVEIVKDLNLALDQSSSFQVGSVFSQGCIVRDSLGNYFFFDSENVNPVPVTVDHSRYVVVEIDKTVHVVSFSGKDASLVTLNSIETCMKMEIDSGDNITCFDCFG